MIIILCLFPEGTFIRISSLEMVHSMLKKMEEAEGKTRDFVHMNFQAIKMLSNLSQEANDGLIKVKETLIKTRHKQFRLNISTSLAHSLLSFYLVTWHCYNRKTNCCH